MIFLYQRKTVDSFNDPVPNLQQKEGISLLDMINTSPIEIAKFMRNIKQSYFSQCGIPGKFY